MLIVLFLVSHFNFLFVPCGGLSWLPVSFLLHVKYTLSYRIVSTEYMNATDGQTDRQTDTHMHSIARQKRDHSGADSNTDTHTDVN